MAQQLSKSDKIRKILHLSNAEIAERIGCREEYVRSVRQRTSASGNPITDAASLNWRENNREYFKAYMREWYRRNRRSEARAP